MSFLQAIPVILLASVGIGYIFWVMRQYAAPAGTEPGAKNDGPFVAEVWLEWEVCRGSTLYRQRFVNEKSAERAVRKAAAKLDRVLPKHYGDTDWSGRRVVYEYEYGIHFGVRPANEHDSTRRIWSPALPGTQSYAGEHATAHPLQHLQDANRQAQLAGFKV